MTLMWFVPDARYQSYINDRTVTLTPGEPVELRLDDIAPIIRDAGWDILGPPVRPEQLEEARRKHQRAVNRKAEAENQRQAQINRALARQHGRCAGWGPDRIDGQPPHPWPGPWVPVETRNGWVVWCADCHADPRRKPS